MYEEYWKLNNRPFENRYDALFYYPSDDHQAALLKLRYAIENRRAAAVLCGSNGMGKSVIAHAIRAQLPEFASPVVSLNYPAMDPEQMIRYVTHQLCGYGSEKHLPVDTAASVEALTQFFQSNNQSSRHAVIVVDEAHLLEQHGLLEPLRLLLNIGSDSSLGESSLTLVLCGLPNMMAHIQRNPGLDERVSVRCVLNRFTSDETIAYVSHRLRAAQGRVEFIFETDALEHIHNLTQGVPRRINRICDLALMVGYAQEAKRVNVDLVDSVHGELTIPTFIE